MGRIHYGWIMLLAIALMTFASSGSRFSFGVFVRPMSEELHWGRDQLALAASLNLLLAGLLRPVVGLLADRYGSRIDGAARRPLGGSALILTSFARELWQFYLSVRRPPGHRLLVRLTGHGHHPGRPAGSSSVGRWPCRSDRPGPRSAS